MDDCFGCELDCGCQILKKHRLLKISGVDTVRLGRLGRFEFEF